MAQPYPAGLADSAAEPPGPGGAARSARRGARQGGAPGRGAGASPGSLYDPANEHDACGVAFVADIEGRRSHSVVTRALGALCRLDHRGARGAEPNTGDGAGISIGIPDEFLRAVVDFPLPPVGSYAVGLVFLPDDDERAGKAVAVLDKYAIVEGATVLGWRDVPTDPEGLGSSALAAMPRIRQVFLAAADLRTGAPLSGIALDRVAFCVRKQAEREARERGLSMYFCSLSARTIVYKGMLTAPQMSGYYPDLKDE
ncbi:MAG TPA: glutamate synthase subunit alpha, partial [Rugosimonospora sp.]|nr:glutamate synthase subunit alpha [Rugosimonospora sp.]